MISMLGKLRNTRRRPFAVELLGAALLTSVGIVTIIML